MNKRVVFAVAPGIGEDQSTNGITLLVGTVRVKLPSLIGGLEVDLGLIDEASNLNVVRGLKELNALQGTTGDHTSAMALFSTPGDFGSLGVGDQGIGGGGGPQAEVWWRVSSVK